MRSERQRTGGAFNETTLFAGDGFFRFGRKVKKCAAVWTKEKGACKSDRYSLSEFSAVNDQLSN